MSGDAMDWLFQLLRCGAVLVVGSLLASLFLTLAKAKPTTQILAWILVLMPGWLLLPVSVEVPWFDPITPPLVENDLSSLLVTSIGELPGSETSTAVDRSTRFNVELFTSAAAVLIWLGGMLFFTCWYTVRHLQLAKRVRSLPAVKHSAWTIDLQLVSEEINLRQSVKLVRTAKSGPAACGLGSQYYLLIPDAAIEQCSASQRAAILHHELAHIQRGDLWVALLGRILLLPQWFNPAAWYALNRLDTAIETGCDATVLQTSGLDRFEYAKSLIAVSAIDNGTFSPGFALSTAGPLLKKRIQQIVTPKGIEMKFARTLTTILSSALALIALVRVELVAQTAALSTQPRMGSNSTEPTNQESKLRATLDNKVKLCPKTYEVGDLLGRKLIRDFKSGLLQGGKTVPTYAAATPNEKVSVEELQEIAELIELNVQSDQWDELYSILPYDQDRSLIVFCPEEVHEEIQTLFAKLRELDRVTIELERLLLFVPESSASDLGQLHATVCDDDFAKVKEAASKQANEIQEFPKVKLLNGQRVCPRPLDSRDLNLPAFELGVIHSADRLSVNIALVKRTRQKDQPTRTKDQFVAVSRDNTNGTEIRVAGGELVSLTNVPDGGYVKIDVTDLADIPTKGERAVLLLRPKIVVRD